MVTLVIVMNLVNIASVMSLHGAWVSVDLQASAQSLLMINIQVHCPIPLWV